MERVHESEKSSRKSRDERAKDIDSSKDHHRDHRERDRDHRHRSDRDKESDKRHHSDKYREEKHHRSKDHYEESKRERSLEPRNGREGSRERGYREKSIEKRSSDRYQSRDYFYDHEESNRERSHEPRDRREGSRDDRVSRGESVERPVLKRKERAGSEDRLDKGEKRRKEDKREKRRFEDKVEDSRDVNGNNREEKREKSELEDRVKEERMQDANGNHNGRRERRKFGDRAKEDEQGSSNQSSSIKNGSVPELLNTTSNAGSEPSYSPDHPPPTKVSSISTPNENKGVSITRSHEVPGKSSTDGTAPASGKSGSLSLDAITKAKELLQKQKELREKMKKLPLKKVSNSSSDNTQQVDGSKPSSTSTLPVSTPVSARPSASGQPNIPGLSAIPNIEAVKRAQELAAKMGFHHDPEFAPIINMFPGQQMPTDVTLQQKPAKAPVLRLDQYGNAIDEHGNIINLSKPANLSTLKVNINKQKKDAFQILKPELDVDPGSNPHFDERMGINKAKLLRPKRMSFQFVDEGQWSKEAEIIKFKSQFGEAQAKELRTKQAQFAKAKFDPNINPNTIEVGERVITKEKPKDPIPDVEWWDVPLLKSGKYEVIDGKINEDNINWEKITIYVEHPRPIEPPAEPAPPPPQPLKLTKKEQKKMRTQRRLAKEKDRQEMIRQGLIEPPKPKVKMSNLMKVLGSEATQDPTRMEMEVRTAAAEREQAHVDRNIARKLTPAERKEKAKRKLFEDRNGLETIVSVYKINDLSHPQTRFKVDVNAQENNLSGCVVIGESMVVVVVEGGGKAIKRYGKLMMRRINWAAAVPEEEGEEEMDVDRPPNRCVLVWQGSVAKPSFHKFLVHQCRSEGAARKVFSDAGVAHYWDLAVNFNDDQV